MIKHTLSILVIIGFFLGCTDDDVNPTGATNPFEIQVSDDGDTTFVFNFAPEVSTVGPLPVAWDSKGRGPISPTNGEGLFLKFDFAVGDTLAPADSLSEEWDIAIRGSLILVNGGEKRGYIDEPERTKDVRAFLIRDSLNGVAIADVNLADLRTIEISSFLKDGFADDPDIEGAKLGAIGKLTEKQNLRDPDGPVNGPTHPFLPFDHLYFIETRDGNYAIFKVTSVYDGYTSQGDEFQQDWLKLIDIYETNGNSLPEGTDWPKGNFLSFEYAYFDLSEEG